MGYFKLGGMTLKSLFKKPETVRYPAEVRPAPEGLKGHIENDIKNCIFCSICAKRCPTGCIEVDKSSETWQINPFDCIQCRTCVRECPQHCLTMAPTYQKPSIEKTIIVMRPPEPTEEEKRELERKEAEKAAKIKAALEAKAKREKEKAAAEAAQASEATAEATGE